MFCDPELFKTLSQLIASADPQLKNLFVWRYIKLLSQVFQGDMLKRMPEVLPGLESSDILATMTTYLLRNE